MSYTTALSIAVCNSLQERQVNLPQKKDKLGEQGRCDKGLTMVGIKQ